MKINNFYYLEKMCIFVIYVGKVINLYKNYDNKRNKKRIS